MEKGKGLARRWAVELHDASSSSSSSAVADPPGFTRSAPDAEDAAGARQRKDSEAAWKGQKAWEVAQAPFKNLMMMGFMMWMAGSTVHLFSIGITFSALWQPISALRSVGKVFEPFKDPRVDTLAPKLLFIALNLAAMGLGVWKLNTLGLLPTNASDWVSSLAPARENFVVKQPSPGLYTRRDILEDEVIPLLPYVPKSQGKNLHEPFTLKLHTALYDHLEELYVRVPV